MASDGVVRVQLTDAMIDHIVIGMTGRQRVSALREALARVRDLEAERNEARLLADELGAALARVDLGEWEDERLREWLPAAAEHQLVERLTARSENLDWELGRANGRVAELEAENEELRGRVAAAEEQVEEILEQQERDYLESFSEGGE